MADEMTEPHANLPGPRGHILEIGLVAIIIALLVYRIGPWYSSDEPKVSPPTASIAPVLPTTAPQVEPTAEPTLAPAASIEEKTAPVVVDEPVKVHRAKKPVKKAVALKNSSGDHLRAMYSKFTPSSLSSIQPELEKSSGRLKRDLNFSSMASDTHAYLGARNKNSRWVSFASNVSTDMEQIDSNDFLTLRSGALADLAQSDYQPALAQARRAVELRPSDPLSRWILGSALFRSGKEKEGSAFLKDAYEKNPTFFPLGESVAGLDNNRGQYAAAEPIARKLLLEEPGDVLAEDLLAESLEGQGKWKEVIERYEPQVANSKDRWVTKLMLAQAYRRAGRFNDANGQMADLVAAQEKSQLKFTQAKEILFYQEHGKLLFDQNQFGKSLVYFEKALSLDPSNATSLKYLAGAQFREKRFKDAVATYDKAVKADPSDIGTRQYQGMALVDNDQLPEGEAVLQDVLSRGGENAAVYFYLARIRESMGNVAEAQSMCKKALTLDPTHEKATAMMGRLKALPGMSVSASN